MSFWKYPVVARTKRSLMAIIDQIIQNTRSGAEKLHVRSALNPVLWLCAIVSIPTLVIAYLTRDNLALFLAFFALGACPVVVAGGGFVFFMLRDPDRLQSEDWQIRHEALDLIRTKGSDVAMLPSSIEAISNPSLGKSPPPPAVEGK